MQAGAYPGPGCSSCALPCRAAGGIEHKMHALTYTRSRLGATRSQTGVPKAIALSSCFILLARPMNAAIQRYVTSLHDVAVTLLSQEAELHSGVTGIFRAVGPRCTPYAPRVGLFSHRLAPSEEGQCRGAQRNVRYRWKGGRVDVAWAITCSTKPRPPRRPQPEASRYLSPLLPCPPCSFPPTPPPLHDTTLPSHPPTHNPVPAVLPPRCSLLRPEYGSVGNSSSPDKVIVRGAQPSCIQGWV